MMQKQWFDYEDFALLALRALEDDDSFQYYTHIVVDETQDLSQAELSVITKLVDSQTNSITLLADAVYCHRKFGPPSKPRLCYNANLLERSYPMAKRRRFTPQFKAEVVIEALSGQSSQAELCRKHNISQEQLSKWKHQLIDNAATLFESNDKHSNASKRQIAQLEQLVGRLTLALDIQKKASTWLN